MASLPLLAVSLSLLCALCAASSASPEAAFMLVSKTIKVKKISDSAEDITVSFTLHNIASSIAYDVALNDEMWPAETFEVVGNTTKSWEKLEGGSTVSHSFVVKPKAQGYFTPSPAAVTFRLTSSPELQTAYSTPVGTIGLLQPLPKGAKWAWLREFAQQFGPLMSAIAIVALMGYVVFVPLGNKKSTKKRR